jgi:hypothetical protein
MMDYYNHCDSNNNLLLGCGSNNVSSTIDIGMGNNISFLFGIRLSLGLVSHHKIIIGEKVERNVA